MMVRRSRSLGLIVAIAAIGATLGCSTPSGGGGDDSIEPVGASRQPLVHGWSDSFGDSNSQSGGPIAVDSSGDVLISGQFSGSVNFGGGTLSTVSSASYLAKLDSSGGHLWSMSFDNVHIAAIDVDSNDNVVITGTVNYVTDFGGGPRYGGISDVFVAKFNSSGSHLWSQVYLTSGFMCESGGGGVAVDGSDNVVLSGYYSGCLYIDPVTCVNETPLYNTFLAKLDSSGDVIFYEFFGDGTTTAGFGFGVATDSSENIVTTGTFNGNIDFGGGTLTSVWSTETFVAAFDSSGSHLWSQTFPSTVHSEGRTVAVDGSDNVVVIGTFLGSVNPGGGALTSAGSNDIFLVQLDNTGTHQWSDSFGGTGADSGWNVAVDASGDVYATGAFSNTVSFGGSSLTSAGLTDVFVAQFDGTGTHIWSAGYGDSGGDGGNGIAVDGSGNVAISGGFQSSIDFGGGSLTSAGSVDIFIAQLTP